METCFNRRRAFVPLLVCKQDVTRGKEKVTTSVVTFPGLQFDWHEYIVHLNDTILKTTGSILFQHLWSACMVVRMRLVGAQNCNNPTPNCPSFKANLPWSPCDLHFGYDPHSLSRFPPLKGIIKTPQARDLGMKVVEKLDVGVSLELGDILGATANVCVVQPSPKETMCAIQPSPRPSPKENTYNIQSTLNANTCHITPSKLGDVVDVKATQCTIPSLNLAEIGRDMTTNICALPSNLEEIVEANTCARQPLIIEENVTENARLEVALSGPSSEGVVDVASVEQVGSTHVWDTNSEQSESRCAVAPTSTPPTTEQENKAVITQQDARCVHGRKMVLKSPSGWSTSPPHPGSEFLQEMGLSSQQQCQTWDLLWERGKPKKVSKLLWNILSKNLPVGASRAALEGEKEVPLQCARCSETSSIETIQHCLYDCPKANEVWDHMARLHKHLGITEPISWEKVLLGCPDILKVHEYLQQARSRNCSPQERRRLRDLLKKMTPLYIWELARAITLWAIWAVRCSFVCYKYELPVKVVILQIWKELVSAAQLVREEIMEKLLSHDPNSAHRLYEMFWVCYDYKDTIFRKGNQKKLLWFKSPPKWLLHPA